MPIYISTYICAWGFSVKNEASMFMSMHLCLDLHAPIVYSIKGRLCDQTWFRFRASLPLSRAPSSTLRYHEILSVYHNIVIMLNENAALLHNSLWIQQLYIYIYICVCVCVCVCVWERERERERERVYSSCVLSKFCLSYLDGLWDKYQLSVQLVFVGCCC